MLSILVNLSANTNKKLKKIEKTVNKLEIIRYIYIALGKILSIDINNMNDISKSFQPTNI